MGGGEERDCHCADSRGAYVCFLQRIFGRGISLRFNLGEDIGLEPTLNKFIAMGYNRSEMVASPGEFSIRGGIIDIYPITEPNPIRIELFDTEIDSIRTFSSEDQRSIEKLKKVTIGPVSEALLETEHIERIITSLRVD